MWRAILAGVNLLAFAGTAMANFENGNRLLEACTAQNFSRCLGYVEGIADVMNGGINPVNEFLACLPKDATLGQLQGIVVKYLYRHADQRHFAAAGLVAGALAEAYPCGK